MVFKKSMITVKYNNILAKKIGVKHGLSSEEWEKGIFMAQKALEKIKKENHAFLELPYDKETVSHIDKFVKKNTHWENIIVLGIGGSALGGITLMRALLPPYSGIFGKKNIFFLDNIDPEQINAVLGNIRLKNTLFIAISKSGKTLETMSQFFIVKKLLGRRFRDNIVIVTDRDKGILRKIAGEENLQSFNVPDGVEGRYSVLSSVSLLPAALAGINIRKILEGAQKLNEKNSLILASAQYLLDNGKGKNMTVFMPYSFRLEKISDWYRQLISESIGKKESAGPTPIKSSGVTDQHSILQLFKAGPNNKFFIFISSENLGKPLNIPNPPKEFNFLKGKTINDLFEAEREGTILSITKSKRPNIEIKMEKIDEKCLGEMLIMLELQVVILAKLYGVNPYGQPAVEQSKDIAKRRLMGMRMA